MAVLFFKCVGTGCHLFSVLVFLFLTGVHAVKESANDYGTYYQRERRGLRNILPKRVQRTTEHITKRNILPKRLVRTTEHITK